MQSYSLDLFNNFVCDPLGQAEADFLSIVRNESEVPDPPMVSPSPQQPPLSSINSGAAATPEQLKMQEDYLKAMLRQPLPQEGQGQAQEGEDPMMKMFQAMMGGMKGADPNAPDGMGGLPALSPDDISKATGLPPFLTNMMMGSQKTPPTQTEMQVTRIWKIVHVVFAILAGLYLVVSINKSTQTFGANPPSPATFQNPFNLFLTGELLLQSTRAMSKGGPGKSGLGLLIQMVKELFGDGMILVFGLGLAQWLNGYL